MNSEFKLSRHLFTNSASMRVRSVELRKDDLVQTQREKLAKIILDDMYQFVALLDAEGTLLEVNRAALEGAGIRLEDIQGKPFWEARWWQVSEESVRRQKEACARAAQGEFVRYDAEIFGSHGGDETITIDYSLIPVTDATGRVVFLLPEGRNITEKKKADAEIARKSQALQDLLNRVTELDELKSQFFANVSHELRTPLALIVGPAEKVLQEGEYLRQEHQHALRVIKRNASTLLKHVNDLLDVAKLDAGKMSTNYARVDLARLLRLVAGHFEALAVDRRVRFGLDVPPSLMAEMDPDKIERVVLNLLSNAFKFTPPGGRIVMSASAAQEGRALICVQDSGPGVPEQDRKLIFERFRQGDGGATRQAGGTGLGLSIAHDFVRMHGGMISVTDAPGGGALFQVELPLRAPEGRHVAAFSEEDERDAQLDAIVSGSIYELAPLLGAKNTVRRERTKVAEQATVLVVEDNEELNRFIVDTLTPEFNVEVAFDGREGLEKVQSLKPDLVVTDIMMPKMSGDQMLRELRHDTSLAAIPVLVLSAKADEALRIQLLENGAQDYVMKPFVSQELRTRVRNLVLVKKAQDRVARTAEKAQAEANQSEAKFRTITNAMPQMVWSTLPDGFADYYNQQWYHFTGVPVGSTDGEAWKELFHPDDQDRTLRVWRESLESGAPYEIQYRLRHQSGEYRWVLGRALPVRDEEGRILRWMGTCTDIHEQKVKEEELKAANQRKDEFLAMLAHELRNPMAPISTAAQLLRKPGVNEKLLRQASEIITRQVKHMTSLVDDLLDVSRVTRGLVQLDKQRVDLKALVAVAVEQVRPLLEAKGHELTTRIGSGDATVLGDRTRLIQIMSNLLSNAAKYTPAGGSISLDVETQERQATIRVSDNGTGIEPALLPHVFELFTQGERTPDRAGGGLGLGLALVKNLVALHGGDVWAHSNGSGEGSTFTVVLPLCNEPGISDIEDDGTTQAESVTRPLAILLVDDNVDAANLLAALLSADGHQVAVAAHPEEALRLASQSKFDAFILDIGLPDIDGHELARRLQADRPSPDSLYIALSGYGQPQDQALSRAAGFHHHFVKPVDHQRLHQLLQEHGRRVAKKGRRRTDVA